MALAKLAHVLEGLEQRLNAVPAGDALPLDKSTLTETAGKAILELFAEQLGEPSLTLTSGATVEPDPSGADQLLVKGTATKMLFGIEKPAIHATFSVAASPSEALALVMTIGTGAGWSLKTSFPQLAQTQLGAGLAIKSGPEPALVLRSFDGADDGFGPSERAGLNLEATLDVEKSTFLGALEPVLELTGVTTIPASGPALCTATAESLTLRANPKTRPIKPPISGLRSIELSEPTVAVSGSAFAAEGGAWEAMASLEVWGKLSAGGDAIPLGISVPVEVPVWRLFVVPEQGVRLREMLGFVPGLSPLDAFPDVLKNAVDVEIDTFSIGLAESDGDWKPWSLDLAVKAPPWPLVPGVLEIENVGVGLSFDLGATPTTYSGYVTGAIKLESVELDAYVPLPLDSGEVSVWLGSPVKLPTLDDLAQLLGGEDLTEHLPSSIGDIPEFELNRLAASIDLEAAGLTDISFGIAAGKWAAIPGQLELEALEISLDVANPLHGAEVTGAVRGEATLSEGSLRVTVGRFSASEDWELEVDVEALKLPSLEELAEIADPDLLELLPARVAENSFELSTLDLKADLSKPAFECFGFVVSTGSWEVTENFEITQIVFELALDWRSGSKVASGSLIAALLIGPPKTPDKQIALELEAERSPDGGWVLSGKTTEPVFLSYVVDYALGVEVPHELESLKLETLSLTYRTAEEPYEESYDFAAALDWSPSFGGVDLDVEAEVALSRGPDPGKKEGVLYSGHLAGDLKSHFGSDQLELRVVYDFGAPGETTYVFELDFNEVKLQATLKTVGGDSVLSVHLGGVTFGEIVEFLVNLVDPSLHFSLSAPWDVLNKLDFDALSLTIDLTNRTIGITYEANENLGIVDIEKIFLTYLHKGGSATVDIAITGSFLGQTYGEDQPLQWDMLNDPPPATPGAGPSAFDLEELAVGQHLTIADRSATTLPDVLTEVHNAIVTTQGKHPWDILEFEPTVGWLFAANFTVSGTVTLGVIFDDPVMYGAQVSLTGPKAGVFAGLEFQILYRKISDTLGQYHVELKLPDAFRHLELGEVSITLPRIILDIYTDGGFYVDLGFPTGGDWSVCFDLEIFPFLGSGGFYFGKLSAAEGASLVPAATNGRFDPVIEFGFALSEGIGKEISEGPLSAGLSLTAKGILTGVLSYFNPTDASQPPALYYKIDGSATIVGKLYGRVDFKVITVEVAVTAEITATLAIAAYSAIHIGLSVEVEVEASIKIVFFRIYFHFHLDLDASFTIGSDRATPWQLANGGSQPESGIARSHLRAAGRAEVAHLALRGSPSLLASPPPPLAWGAPAVMGSEPARVEVRLLPTLTAAGEALEAVVPAVVPTGAPSEHVSIEELRRAAAESGEQPFDVLAKALLRWGVEARLGRHEGMIAQAELRQIHLDLGRPDIQAQGGPFAYGNLVEFLEANLVFRLAPPPAENEAEGGAVLPIMPPLCMEHGGTTVKFEETPQVDAEWQKEVSEAFAKLLANFEYNRSEDPLEEFPEPPVFEDEPIAKALFSDWFLLAAKALFGAAIETTAKVTHVTQGAESLAGLAAQYAPAVEYAPRRGETQAEVAELFGVPLSALRAVVEDGETFEVPPPMTEAAYVVAPGETPATIAADWRTTAAQIKSANPGLTDEPEAGTELKIPVPVELFAIADANLDAELGPVQLKLPGIAHTVQAGETLAAVGAAYAIADLEGILAANAADTGLLRAGATLEIALESGGIPYPVAEDDTAERIAAFARVRNLGAAAIAEDSDFSWFTSAITKANPAVSFEKPPAVGTQLTIPNVQLQEGLLKPVPGAETLTYLTKKGDTLELIAGYFLMIELREQELAVLKATIEKEYPQLHPGTPIVLPAQSHEIVLGDTLHDLAERFDLEAAQLAAKNKSADVFRPTAQLSLPLWFSISGTGKTLTSLAALAELSIDELVSRLGGREGLFAGGQELQIPGGRRQTDVEELYQALIEGRTAEVGAQASNFLARGLRVPDPITKTMTGIYQLNKQQFAVPEGSVALSFTAPTAPKWIEFPTKDGLSFDLEKATVEQRRPATMLEPAVTKNPVRTVLAHEAQALHPMGTDSQWAAASPPTLIPGEASPRSTLFPLPPQVVAKARTPGAEPLAYELMTIPQGQGEAAATEVAVYSWATWVPFRVRRIPAPGGGSLSGVYEIAAVEREGLSALLELLEDVRAEGRAPEPLQLLYSPPSGPVLSDALVPAKTAILKANLSTETHGGPQLAFAADPPAPAAAYASLETRADFLALLWEAGVTAAGGFHLTYETSAGTALPDAAFDAGGEARLTALVLLQGQERIVYPYTTGAVAAAGIDRTKMSVYARSADPGDRVTVPTAPPGNVGFSLARENPSEAADSEQTRTRQLYSLLGWTVEAAGGFEATAQTVPVGPTLPKPALGLGKDWYYEQTLAAFRLASQQPPSFAPGLPEPGEDPYAGIGPEAAVSLQLAFRDLFGNELEKGSQLTLPSLPFRYYDPVIGLSAWPGASAHYSFPGPGLLAEIDLGVARYVPGSGRSFPAAVRAAAAHAKSYAQIHYQLQQGDVKCTLETSLDQPGVPCLGGDAVVRPLRAFVMASYLYLNAAAAVKQTEYTIPSDGPAVTLAKAAATYDVTLTALVEANAAADLSRLLDGKLQVPRLYTVKAGETMQAVATATGKDTEALLTANQLVPLAPRPGAGAYRTRPLPGDPRNALNAIAALESVTVGDLGTANAGANGILNPAATVAFGGSQHPIGPKDTLATLAKGLGTTPAQLAAANAANADLLLPAAELAVPAVPVIETDPRTVTAAGTFAELAVANRCTIDALATENEKAPILRAGATVEVQGTTVAVGGEQNLASVVKALGEAKPTVSATAAEVAMAALAVPDLLVEGAQLTVNDYVVSAGQTPASLAAAEVIPLARLAALNVTKPADLFPAGTPLVVETSSVDLSPGDSFAAIAADRGLTVAQLAAANADTVPAPKAPLAVPGAIEPLTPAAGVGQGARYLAPGKQTTLGEVSKGLCGDFGQVGTLAGLNRKMTGLIAADVQVSYPGHAPVTTGPGSTLETLSQECGAAGLEAFAADPSVRDNPDLLAPGALLATPPAQTAGRPLTKVAEELGVDAVDLATANSALVGLVKEGFVFKMKGAKAKAGAHSTIQSVLRRLQAADPTIAMGELVEACGNDPAAFADVALLVPPPRIEIAAAMPDPHLASTFAPLEAAIAIARDPDLVDPGLEDASNVVSSTTTLAPLIDTEEGLAPFAEGFEKVFAKRRLKLGAGPQPAAGAPRLYAVDFGAGGIAGIELEKSTPRFYALAPLRCELASGSVSIRNWDPTTQTFEGALEHSFHSIDLDVWLRAALEAIDLVLSPAYAGPLWKASDSTPVAYAQIVAAKSQIAAGLRGQVAEILQKPADPAALAAAQEALYQSMLGSLTSAYTTDALIQFPVAAQSPFGTPYVVQDADEGFGSAASFYGVSPESLASALANVPDLLRAEAQVQAIATGRTYTIATGDTPAKVATELGFAQVSELPAGISPETRLFASGASLLVSSMERAIVAGDTFLTLAEFFGADPADVGVAVQDVPGLIAAGTPVRGYTVADGDTLRSIAHQVQATAAELAADPALVGEPVLAVAKSVHCISPTNPIAPRLSGKAVGTAKVDDPPGFSLSTAKTSLAAGTSHVTFRLGVDGVESRKDLLLELDYRPTELEVQIESVPGMGAYQASDWIRFPIALPSEAFEGAVELRPGETEVPLPLRAYPALPSVLSQTAAAVDPEATEIEAAKQWCFDLAVRHQDAAQDELQILLELGEGGSTMAEAVAVEPVFAALAQFNTVWPALREALGELPGASAAKAKTIAPSIKAFAEIASALGQAFERQALQDEGRGRADGAEFRFQLDYVQTALDLTWVDPQPGLSVPWPGITLDGKVLSAKPPEGNSRRRYCLEGEAPASMLNEYEFRFPDPAADSPAGFDAIRWQAASGAAAVRRNASLVSDAETAEAFVYQTPWVRFANPAVPLIENAMPIQVGQGFDLLDPLKEALTKMLTADGQLLNESYELRIQCRYAHPLIPGQDIVTYLPVLLAPLETIKGDEIEPLASKLAAQASAWFATNSIVAAPGDAYVIDLTFYAKADGTHAKPLIELSNLRIPVMGAT